MNDLINQLFDIATNEEFSPGQRKEMLALALRGHAFLDEPMTKGVVGIVVERDPSLTLNIDETLGRSLTKERTPNGIRFGLSTFSANE